MLRSTDSTRPSSISYVFCELLLAPLVDWALRFTVTSSPDFVTLRLPLTVSPLRVCAVVERDDVLPEVVRWVVPLERAPDQLPPSRWDSG